MKKFIFLAALILLGSTRILAVTAYPELITFHQPGTKTYLNIYLMGDEKIHWAETEDGYALLHGDDGTFRYATLDARGGMVPSAFMATSPADRTPEIMAFLSNTKKHLHYSDQQIKGLLSIWTDVERMSKSTSPKDALGQKHFLVILFASSDIAFTHSRRDFENLLNQVNYTVNGSTGSVHDYYYDVSFGQFDIQFDVVGPYTGTQTMAHYGNSNNGYQDFAGEAVDSAAKDVDFSDYDNDGDGSIDGMHIIFAGHGEEASGNADEIWSHKWNIFDPPTYNNTLINVYSCSPECSGSNGNNMTRIGVICHELGHVFGAPDYYDTDYSGSGGNYPGLGDWDIMSGGSWNNGGITPAHHNPYTKIYIYHWATCDTLVDPQMVTLSSVSVNNTDFHRINTATNGDFFLLENRQQVKWDHALPGAGMLVYHIHPNAHGASVSNSTHPQQIYILAQTSLMDTFPSSDPYSYGSLNSSTAAYPAHGVRQELTDFTIPSIRPWSRVCNNTPLTYISANTLYKTISFCFKGALPQSSQLSAEGVSDNKIRLDWVNYGSLASMIICSEDNVFGTPQGNYAVGDTVIGGGKVVFLGSANTAYIDSLNANTHYFFQHYMRLTDSTYVQVPLTADASTLTCSANSWNQEDFESTALGTLPDCWTGDGSVSGNGLNHSLTLGDDDAVIAMRTVETAPIDFPDSVANVVLQFKAVFHNCTDNDTLKIISHADVEGEWKTIAAFTPSQIDARSNTLYVDISEFSHYTRLGFTFTQNGSNSLTIDDIQITPGYLVYAFVSGEGGTIEPAGYSIHAGNDSLSFSAHRAPGYKFANFYHDDNLVTNRCTYDEEMNPHYSLVVKKSVVLRATFVRNLAIETVEADALRVYPNPTNGRLTVDLTPANNADVQSLRVYNLFGQQVYFQTILADQRSVSLDLSSLPRGIYLLRADGKTVKVVLR